MNCFSCRLMRENDIEDVLRIQSMAYEPFFHESRAAFYAKFMASPETCLILERHHITAGYVVSLPVCRESPPLLNAEEISPFPHADALYLHDLAIAPEYHGQGAAKLLLRTLLHSPVARQLPLTVLFAVQDSAVFWKKQGFDVPLKLLPQVQEKLFSYGQGAVYLERHNRY